MVTGLNISFKINNLVVTKLGHRMVTALLRVTMVSMVSRKSLILKEVTETGNPGGTTYMWITHTIHEHSSHIVSIIII